MLEIRERELPAAAGSVGTLEPYSMTVNVLMVDDWSAWWTFKPRCGPWSLVTQFLCMIDLLHSSCLLGLYRYVQHQKGRFKSTERCF